MLRLHVPKKGKINGVRSITALGNRSSGKAIKGQVDVVLFLDCVTFLLHDYIIC